MSPTLELQGAITVALKSASALTTIIGQRVYDDVPRNPVGAVTAQFPFVAHGNSDEVQDDYECVEGVEITYEIECWSRSVGYVEALRIAHEVKAALHNASFTLTTNALCILEHVQTRKDRDPDGKTSRTTVQFRAIVETP
jgi:hypothetical protein